ncbi:MAG: hypothetical protein ACKVGW_17845, partial [Verrucomicrobiia bacterium]
MERKRDFRSRAGACATPRSKRAISYRGTAQALALLSRICLLTQCSLALGCHAAEPDFADAEITGIPENPNIRETSGLDTSLINDGVFYLHNDSGEEIPRVFALTREGRDLGEYVFPGLGKPNDWEDMRVGPGPESGKSYLYMASFGDNAKRRSNYTIFRAEEPTISLDQAPGSRDLKGSVDVFEYRYDDANTSYNSECLLIDPLTKDLYIVTKSPQRRVFRYAYPQNKDIKKTLEYLGTIPEFSDEDQRPTGGDMTETEMVIRTPIRAYYWKKGNKTWKEVFQTAGKPIASAIEDTRGEAICFDHDGVHLYSLPEGVRK